MSVERSMLGLYHSVVWDAKHGYGVNWLKHGLCREVYCQTTYPTISAPSPSLY